MFFLGTRCIDIIITSLVKERFQLLQAVYFLIDSAYQVSVAGHAFRYVAYLETDNISARGQQLLIDHVLSLMCFQAIACRKQLTTYEWTQTRPYPVIYTGSLAKCCLRTRVCARI